VSDSTRALPGRRRDARKIQSSAPAILRRSLRTTKDYVQAITASWRESAKAIIEVGKLLLRAKEELEHGKFTAMITDRLPFGPRTAQMLMAIAADERLADPKRLSCLPPSWGTMYQLTRLDDAQFERGIAEGVIRPDMERNHVATLVKQRRRVEREAALAEKITALPARKFGVILSDCEWNFKVRSERGMDRHAANHYPVSSLEALCARDVPSIAARDCVLFHWATGAMIREALQVMEAWGFQYKSQIVWAKDRIGPGYWFREQHELLLVGTRGEVPAPAMGTQWPSVVYAPRGKHSAKPAVFYEMIEDYFPTLPKIELNARGASRPGWEAWGNEAEAA
jgi:N6-adenosine-specific RNA methylase IME4